MILITGAAGKTGQAVLNALSERGETVSVLVRSQEQAEMLTKMGAASATIGDMTKLSSFEEAMEGAEAVYHICPNMHPGEVEIGQMAINAALKFGLEHFVYHSVLHPQTEKMPHHWRKLQVEELLFESGLRYTILQPAPYMQNILAGKKSILDEGYYRVPYPADTKFSMVDLVDLGRAAALVLTEPGHKEAVYEIVGSKGLTQVEVAAVLSRVLEQPVTVKEIKLEAWRSDAEETGMGQYEIKTLNRMFEYYASYGLCGNNFVLRQILGRDPHSLTDFGSREFFRH